MLAAARRPSAVQIERQPKGQSLRTERCRVQEPGGAGCWASRATSSEPSAKEQQYCCQALRPQATEGSASVPWGPGLPWRLGSQFLQDESERK